MWQQPRKPPPPPPAEPVDAATEAEIKTLYRKMCRRFHPDLSQDPTEQAWRTELMTAINAAYAARAAAYYAATDDAVYAAAYAAVRAAHAAAYAAYDAADATRHAACAAAHAADAATCLDLVAIAHQAMGE